jgi:hypothetical protein
MKKANPEEEISLIIGDCDSELFERLKEILEKTKH